MGVAVVIVGVAVPVGVGLGGDGARRPGGLPERARISRQAAAEPTRYAVAPRAPRTVPAVRVYRAGGGPGWRPVDGARVVARAGALADEARRVAGELGLGSGSGRGRTGDVELALDKGVPGGREAYRITVPVNGPVRITGPSDAGVFYGTRTLLQAVRSGGGLPPGVIDDQPDRAQRGFMLDIARKHFPRAWIEERLVELADLKYNQLGLHFSDDQAFRIESDTHPEVVSDPHLTKADVRRIVALARELHIEVIPEIDSPGHLGAVLAAHPALRLRNADGDVVPGAVDVTKPAAARLVDELLGEYVPLFPGRYWHIGGDEYAPLLSTDPEARYPHLAAAARRKYGPNGRVQDLAVGWLNDRAKVPVKAGKRVKAWNDGIYPGGVAKTPKDREVEYWTGKEYRARDPQLYLAEGRRLVNLNDEYLYYVLGEPNDFAYPTGRRIYEEWTPAVVRGTAPVPGGLSGPDRILGARLAVWCDLAGAQTTDQVAAGIRLPLAALAQKVWDPRPPALSWAAFQELAGRVR
ncbi:glycoside hydrolase family 20 protein [Streptomyces sp. NPDC051940]|uniref:beta-N-acetylhexosaminidase n=1 Tax=Streptomyces sp. NPDC051940 TaxID=3155675 RepID=UPI003433AA86